MIVDSYLVYAVMSVTNLRRNKRVYDVLKSSDAQKPAGDLIPSKTWLYVFGGLAIISAILALSLRMDNRFENMLNSTSEEAGTYDEFLDTFGSDEFIIVGISGKPIFEESALDVMVETLENLETVPFVEMVTGIPTVYRDRFGSEDPEALVDEIVSTPFYRGLFISEDESIAGLLVNTEELNNPGDRELLVEGLENAVIPLENYGFRVDLVGGPIFNVRLNGISMKESFRIFPIAAVLSLIVLFGFLRSFRAIIVVILCGALSLLYTISLVAIWGRTLNVVTSMLPIILWVLAIANCIHLVCRYQYYRVTIPDAREALRAALMDVRRACTLSAITTSFGFISLTLADIGPIQELGFLMSAGLLISLAVNLLLGPNLLLLMNVPAPRGKEANSDHWFRAIGTRAFQFRSVILVLCCGVAAAGLYSAFNVQTERDSLAFMPEGSETVESYRFVLGNLTGSGTLEIAIQTPDGWLAEEYWEPISNLKSRLSESSLVPRVMSPYDFLKKIRQWDEDLEPESYRLPDSKEHAEELLEILEPEDKTELRRLVTDDGKTVRVTAIISSTDSNDLRKVANIALEELDRLPAPLTGYATGIGLRMEKMQAKLVSTQIKTFSLAFVLVFLCISIGLKSMRLMIVAIFPNLVPILTVFVSMYLLKISLDAATVMVASIALGIAVDDTVHLLTAIFHERRKGQDTQEAVVNGVVRIGASISVTTVAAAIGFFTLSLSEFIPVAYFGLLSGIAMVMALGADFLLVPALFSFGATISSTRK
jgi:predicted RND superfamily exporter protein